LSDQPPDMDASSSPEAVKANKTDKTIRVIARLDIKGPNLVKGVHLEGLRVLGKPDAFARYYYENGADELFYQDVVASLYERNSLRDIVSTTARRSFIPLTVGGGIRTIDDIREVLRAGADKVCINTAAVRNPSFIREASLKFGSSTIVVAVEAIRQPDGSYHAFVDNGRETTGLEVVEWSKKAAELGAGEILVTSVDREGTGQGYDSALIRSISQAVGVSVIAHGGPGKVEHVSEGVLDGRADAVAVASLIHYDFIANRQTDMQDRSEGNISFLQSGRRGFGRIEPCSIMEIKEHFLKSGISCRI
jgi:cyclase